MPSETALRSPFRDGAEARIDFAVLGDVEPKTEPAFEYLKAAVEAINSRWSAGRLDFVAGIGDLPHKGTEDQYRSVTRILKGLESPIYPILGNEELSQGDHDVDRFLDYVSQWNAGEEPLTGVQYTKRLRSCQFIFASATANGKDFSSSELDWIEDRLEEGEELPAILFVHAAPEGVFPDGRSMNVDFSRVLEHENVEVVFSGHSHMNLDAVTYHARDDWGTHHVHVPGIERTKVGNEHVSRIWFCRINADYTLQARCYNLTAGHFEDEHRIDVPIESGRSVE